MIAKLNDADWLKRKYLDEGCNCREIAEIVGCDQRTVSRRLKSLGIERRCPAHLRERKYSSAFESCLARAKFEYVRGARIRKIEWKLHDDEFASLVTGDCHYCGRSPDRPINRLGTTLYFNGIDRKDNGKAYVLDNCVTCCSACNYMKGTVEYCAFVEWLILVSRQWAKAIPA